MYSDAFLDKVVHVLYLMGSGFFKFADSAIQWLSAQPVGYLWLGPMVLAFLFVALFDIFPLVWQAGLSADRWKRVLNFFVVLSVWFLVVMLIMESINHADKKIQAEYDAMPRSEYSSIPDDQVYRFVDYSKMTNEELEESFKIDLDRY